MRPQTPAPVRGEIVRQIGDALRAKRDALGRLVSLVSVCLVQCSRLKLRMNLLPDPSPSSRPAQCYHGLGRLDAVVRDVDRQSMPAERVFPCAAGDGQDPFRGHWRGESMNNDVQRAAQSGLWIRMREPQRRLLQCGQLPTSWSGACSSTTAPLIISAVARTPAHVSQRTQFALSYGAIRNFAGARVHRRVRLGGWTVPDNRW